MEQIETAVEDNNQVTPIDSNNMEQIDIAVEDNNQQVTSVDLNNMEQIEIAVEDNNQVAPANSINMKEIEVVDKDSMLMPLIDMLKNEESFSIDELKLLDQFPLNDMILPAINCNPRQVIKHLLYIRARPYHRIYCVSSIHYKYKRNSINCTKMDEYTFNDNMSLGEDIIIICYLTCLENQYLDMPGIRELHSMMEDKYDIIPEEAVHKMDYFVITWFHVLHSFPSVALACINAPIKVPSSSDLCIHMDFLISSIRKRMIWCYVIASVLPHLEKDALPVSCLVAIKIELVQILNQINVPFNTVINAKQILHNITSLCSSEVFPVALKLELCERWDIIQRVDEQHKQYKYVDYFQECYDVVSTCLPSIDVQDCNELWNFLQLP